MNHTPSVLFILRTRQTLEFQPRHVSVLPQRGSMRLVNVWKILQDGYHGIASHLGLEPAHPFVFGHLVGEGMLGGLYRPTVEATQPRARDPPDICDTGRRHFGVRGRRIENLLEVQDIPDVLVHLYFGSAVEVMERRRLGRE